MQSLLLQMEVSVAGLSCSGFKFSPWGDPWEGAAVCFWLTLDSVSGGLLMEPASSSASFPSSPTYGQRFLFIGSCQPINESHPS